MVRLPPANGSPKKSPSLGFLGPAYGNRRTRHILQELCEKVKWAFLESHAGFTAKLVKIGGYTFSIFMV
jgi:hypothetical protein